MFDNGNAMSNLFVAAIIIVGLLLIFRFAVWWWLGIGERLHEAKRTNTLLERNNELLEQLMTPPPSPPVEIPTAETQPRRNPLTQR